MAAETKCYNFTLTNWMPCTLLWVLTPLEIYYSRRNRTNDIPWTGLTGMKLMLIGMLIVCNIVRLSEANDKNFIGEHIFLFITLILAACLINLNRSLGQRSSTVLLFYWLIETISSLIAYIVSIENLRSQNFSGNQLTINAINLIALPLVVGQLVLSFFSDAHPYVSNAFKNQITSAEYETTMLSTLLFSWINSYVFQKELLNFSSIKSLLNWQDKLQHVRVQLNKTFNFRYTQLFRFKAGNIINTIFEWKSQQSEIHYEIKGVKTWNLPLIPLSFRLLGLNFVLALVIRIISDLLLWVNPFLLSFLLSLIYENPGSWCAYIVVSTIFINSLIQCLMNNHAEHIVTTVSIRTRGVFISTIYEKILRSFAFVIQSTSTAELTDLTTVDADHVKNLVQILPIIISLFIQIPLALYFLYFLIGKVSIVCLVLAAIILIGIAAIDYKTRKFYKQTHTPADQLKSCQLMKKIFQGLKTLKLLAWEVPYMKLIEGERIEEMTYSHYLFYWSNLLMWISFAMPFMIHVAVVVAYYASETPEEILPRPLLVAFTVINIFCTLLQKVPQHFYSVYRAIVSLIKFKNFMQLAELDNEILTSYEVKDDSVISIQDGRFSWSPCEPPTLKEIRLKIKQGQLVVITGPPGSGKASLIAAILGEMDKLRGRMSIQGRLAYVPREPWIYNATIKDNILFGHVPNDFMYEKVVQSCQLLQLMKGASLGDLTYIGSLGEQLTKQQMQQLCIARAAYSNADIYALENFLVNMGESLAENLFRRVIGPEGILKEKTRIIVTNHIPFVKCADLVIVMYKGFITFSGSYKEAAELLDKDGSDGNEKLSETCTAKENTKLNQTKLQKWKYSKKLRDCLQFYIQSGGAWNWCLWFILIGITITLFIASHFALQSWLDATGYPIKTSDYNFAILLYMLTTLFCLVVLYINEFIIFNAVETSSINLTSTVLKTLFQLSLKTIEDMSVQWNYIQTIFSHLKITEYIFPIAISQTLTLTGIILSLLAIIAVFQPVSCIFALIFALLYCYLQGVFNRVQYWTLKHEHQSWKPILTLMNETIEGLTTIRAFKREKEFLREIETQLDVTNTYSFASALVDRWLLVRVDLLIISLMLCTGIGCVFVEQSPATVGVIFICVWKLQELMQDLIISLSALDATSESLSNIQICCNLPKEPPWVLATPVILMWPSMGVVSFKAYVSCQYDKLDLLLRGITCEISSGEKIGVVGKVAETNAFMEALVCLAEPIAGNVYIDGVDINSIGIHQLRSQIGIISMNTCAIFPGTIRTNIDPFFEHSDDEVWKALHTSHLSNFVHNLPLGLHDQIHEDDLVSNPKWLGALTLARVCLRNNRVIILDQTSDLLDKSVVENTLRWCNDCTLICLATRLEDVNNCDKVILLDGGVIRCFQNPQETANQLGVHLRE